MPEPLNDSVDVPPASKFVPVTVKLEIVAPCAPDVGLTVAGAGGGATGVALNAAIYALHDTLALNVEVNVYEPAVDVIWSSTNASPSDTRGVQPPAGVFVKPPAVSLLANPINSSTACDVVTGPEFGALLFAPAFALA